MLIIGKSTKKIQVRSNSQLLFNKEFEKRFSQRPFNCLCGRKYIIFGNKNQEFFRNSIIIEHLIFDCPNRPPLCNYWSYIGELVKSPYEGTFREYGTLKSVFVRQKKMKRINKK